MAEFFMDLSNVADDDLLPKGEYQLESINAELKQTKAGDGQYIAIEFAVVAGKYRGWKIYDNINVRNPNPMAVEIGQKKLKKLLKASGSNNFVVRSIRDVIGLRVVGNIDIRKDGGYGDSNIIKFYSSLQGGTQAPQQQYIKPAERMITNDDIPF